MTGLSSWIAQLGFLILFAAVAEMILPDNSVRKVARLVVGLIVIAAMLGPVVDFLASPDWIYGRIEEFWAADAGEAIAGGLALSQEMSERAESVWLEGIAADLALMLTLLDGVDDARVRIIPLGRGAGGVLKVDAEVVLFAEDGAESRDGASAGAGGRLEEEARALVIRLLRGVETKEVRVVRSDAPQADAGGSW